MGCVSRDSRGNGVERSARHGPVLKRLRGREGWLISSRGHRSTAVMSSQAHDRPLTLHPGTSLGPYTLGDTLWRVLETLRARGNERAVAVRWDREVSPS